LPQLDKKDVIRHDNIKKPDPPKPIKQEEDKNVT
tara:strand:- start:2596 stop:2697 length:102 start_codon:yes stop_codon:yes gene_type:complete